MSNGAILTSGYINLTNAVYLLNDRGFDVVKLYGLRGTAESDRCIDESDIIDNLINEELKKDGFDLLDNKTVAKGNQQVNIEVISLFSVGGKFFKDDTYFMGIIDNELSASISKANAAYRYVKESNERYKYSAALLHADGGSIWRSVITACRELDIPTFVCYNGAITECVPKYAATSYYNNADVYYLHGRYAEDWIKKRYNYNGGYPLVGQPSFDDYYINKSEIEEDTFLYNSKTVFSKYEETLSGLALLLDKAQFSMLSTKLPSDMDEKFFKAFAKFQEEIYPEAKLLISLRPYHSAAKEDYTNYVHKYGVRNFKVIPYNEQPIKELIPTVEYVITGASTVAIESVINRNAVLLLPGNSDYESYSFEDEWAVRAKDMSEDSIIDGLICMVEEKEELFDICDFYASYFNYGDDGKASERLVEDLIRRIA